MSFDTTTVNKQRQDLDQFNEIWLFGYGSILYKVDFEYELKQPAYIKHWQRQFWQGSHDHRGTPEAPGRVVTLCPHKDNLCYGLAFKVSKEVFEHLDHREKNGYLRHEIPLHFNDGSSKAGIVYIADQHNAAYLGPAPLEQMAKQIAQCHGPSGSNQAYLLELDQALKTLNIEDAHIHDLAHAVRQLL